MKSRRLIPLSGKEEYSPWKNRTERYQSNHKVVHLTIAGEIISCGQPGYRLSPHLCPGYLVETLNQPCTNFATRPAVQLTNNCTEEVERAIDRWLWSSQWALSEYLTTLEIYRGRIDLRWRKHSHAVEAPEEALQNLEYLTPSQFHQFLNRWNTPTLVYNSSNRAENHMNWLHGVQNMKVLSAMGHFWCSLAFKIINHNCGMGRKQSTTLPGGTTRSRGADALV